VTDHRPTQSPPRPIPSGWLLYWGVGIPLFTVILRWIFRTRIVGRERVPRRGGLLIVANHISFADPPLIAVTMPRRVDFMTMVELYRKPVLGWLARRLGTFPVDRSRADQTAAREAIRRLRAGRCVALFPEAGIRLNEQSVLGGNPVFKPGAGAIALLGGAAILPVVIRDSRKPYRWPNWFRRETMSVTFGYPFSLWLPKSLPGDERRRLARELVREQLLKTVELT
jgi:1-acyl-sn-glycerol-3-phosphate acyltransferase